MERISEMEQLDELAENELDSERGAAMVEYALLVAFVAVVAVVALTLLGETVSGEF